MLSGIEVGNCLGGVVGDVPVKHVSEHLQGDIVVEFFDLFPNVAKESIAGPSADHHDEEDWATPKEHGGLWPSSGYLASGVPLHPGWPNDTVQPTSSWWLLLWRSLGGKLAE